MEKSVLEDMKKIGITYGDIGTSRLKCNVTAMVDEGEYVKLYHEETGWVLGRVQKVERITDLSLQKAYEISSGKNVDIQEMVSADIIIIGYRDDMGMLRNPRTPFSAGSILYMADDDFIRETLGLDTLERTGAYIGKIMGHDIMVYLDINNLVQKHVSILAKTGSGKSYLTGVLIEELLKHDVTTVIIDPHGEYSSLKKAAKKSERHTEFGISPKGYADKIKVLTPDPNVNKGEPLRFTLSAMTPRDLLNFTTLKSSTRTYLMTLRRAMDTLKISKGNHYTLKDLIRMLENSEEENPVVGSLINELEYLESIGIFAARGTRIDEIVQKGRSSIINLKGVDSDIQELVVQRIASALFEMRKKNKIPPLFLVVEEAHNYVPQQGQVMSSKIMRTIASEGRKFGLGLCIISQRAAKIDKNVLSQCNTQIILKVTNPNDLKAISNSVEGIDTHTIDEIQRLPPGVALVMGGSLPLPIFVEIRPRVTVHGGESVKVIEDE